MRQTVIIAGCVVGVGFLIIALAAYLTKPIAGDGEASESRISAGVIEVMPSTEELKAALDNAATEKAVYWQVWCTTFHEGDPEEWMGVATHGKSLNFYIEDGAEDYWRTASCETTNEAAFKLLHLLDGPPNVRPHHRPTPLIACPQEEWKGGPR